MLRFRTTVRIMWVLGLRLVLGDAAARAGHLPVFRCALEEWPAQDYQVVVFHRGPLEDEDRNLFDALKEAPLKWGANIAASTVDVLEPMDESTQALWTAQADAEPPWMLVTATGNESTAPVWAGRFQEDAVKTLLDSPARRKMIESLLQGDSAVWVLLESGDAVRDEAAVDTLAGSLKRLEKELRLPAASPGKSVAKSPLPLLVAFSLVRVTRNDPAEELFVNALLHGERIPPGKPAAFPVFGRGRALSAISGKHLQDEFIQAACRFITGACSNGVKESRSGKDLLLAARWDSIFTNAAQAATQSPTNAALLQEGQTKREPSSPSNKAPDERPSVKALLMMGVAVLAMAGLTFLFLRRSRRRS